MLLVPAAAALAVASSGGAKPELDASWTSYGHDAQLTGFTDAPLFNAQVKGFAPVWKASLTGAVIASPLAARTSAQGLVVFAATEAGNVYAIGDGGAVLWQKSLGTVLTNGNCGIYGVSSTGAIDTARGVGRERSGEGRPDRQGASAECRSEGEAHRAIHEGARRRASRAETQELPGAQTRTEKRHSISSSLP